MLIVVRMANPSYIFIEGHYLDLITRHLFPAEHSRASIRVDFYKLSMALAREQGLWWGKTFYYCAPPYQSEPPTEAEARKRAGYDRYINIVKRFKNFTIREGRCQKIDGGYNEKGVDTLLTMDLMRLSENKEIKDIILLTCDTDFIPIIKDVRTRGVNVVLYYFTDHARHSKFSFSNDLTQACDKSALITKELLDGAKLLPKH